MATFVSKPENKPKTNENEKKNAEEKEEELDPVKLVMVSHDHLYTPDMGQALGSNA